MKFKQGQLKTLATQIPKDFKGFLIYGSDNGAIKESALYILSLINKTKDPYAVQEITTDRLKETPTLFWDELNAISMFGGRRILWFKNPTDAFAKEVESFLKTDTGDTFLLMTSDTLNTKSTLVKLCDGAGEMGCLGCYPETEQDIRQTISSTLSANGYLIAPDALALLTSYLGADKAITRNEIDKLMLFLGHQKQVTVEDVQASIGNGAPVNLDDLMMNVLQGSHAMVQKIYPLLIQEGIQPVMITRAMINKCVQLMTVLSKIKKGDMVDNAIKSTPPFIPFKYGQTWKKIVLSWSEAGAAEAFQLLLETEKNCKTGLPADIICNRALTSVTNAGKKFTASRY